MVWSRAYIFPYLMAIYLVYSTINSFSIYSLGVLANIVMVLLLCITGFAIRDKVANDLTEARIFFIGWSLVFLISLVFSATRPLVPMFVSFVFCCFYLCLNDETQHKIFKLFVWLLSSLVLLSAVEYVLYSLFGKGVVLSVVTRVQPQGDTNFYHLFFNVIAQSLVPRFQGLFKEPGNMGTACAFMLFATWKNKSLRFPFYVFLVCGLLSLSLGFYVFLMIFVFTSIKPNVKNVVAALLIALPVLFIFKDSFDVRILERISRADSLEDLDDRTTYSFDRSFKSAMENGELWTGVGAGNLPKSVSTDGGNAGAKKWVYQYGIISLIIIFYIYNIIYFIRTGRKFEYYDIVFLFVFWVCFYKSVIFTTPSLFVIYSIMPLLNKADVVIDSNDNNV